VLWIAFFIAACALFAAWTVVSDHAHERERRLKRIHRRLAEKENAKRDE
jgi:hypothetical protein